MNFPQQSLLQRQLPNVRELFLRHTLTCNNIERLAPSIELFEIRLPFIGAFSSGKSSLINALIGEPLLSTEITPETTLPAELRSGHERRFTGHLPDGKKFELTEVDVQENQLHMLQPHGWLHIELPSPMLEKIPHLILVDMPGWSSGIAAHQCAIDDYADRSLAYVVVVSIEEGTLRTTLRQALLELAVQEKPVILAIAKAHKRNESDVSAIVQRLTEEITELMGRPPLAVALTSAAKRDTAQLAQALFQLESRAQKIFDASIVTPWHNELQRASQLLQLLASQEFKDAELISAEIESFEQKMCEFDLRLARETEGLAERIGPMISAIRQRVDNALNGRLESITQRALAGENISDDILGTARVVVAQALKEEFEPAMLRYLDRLTDALPSRLDFNLDLSSIQKKTAGANEDFQWKGLVTILAPLLLKIPHPLGKIAAVILPFLANIFGNSHDEQRQDAEESRQRERAKTQVRHALSQAVAQIEEQLRPAMQEQVKNAQEAIRKSIAAERADIECTLASKRQALLDGEAQTAALRNQAQADLQQLAAFLAEITLPAP